MKKIFLFLTLFFSTLYCADNFSSENYEEETPFFSMQSNSLTQNPPKFWHIKDINNKKINYAATETSIKIVLAVLDSLKKEKLEIISKLYLSCHFPAKEKISHQYIANSLSTPNSINLMILVKKDGTIKTEWVRHLIMHSILFNENYKILTFEELKKNNAIFPINEEDKINFWKIENKTFATETIKFVILTLQQIYLINYTLILKLKKACDQDIDKISDDSIELLIKNRFTKANGTLNLWAKIITSKVLYKHPGAGIQLRSFEYLIKNNIIVACQTDPIPNQEINEFDSDIISSEVILKEDGEYDDKKKIDYSNINVQLNNIIMQENETTCTSNSKINYNNCN